MNRQQESIDRLRTWISEGTLLKSEGRTSISLNRAVASLCGAEPPGPSDDAMAPLAEEIGGYDHYLYVLVDGLGMNQKPNFPPGGFFDTYFHSPLRSVFPSTTAAALTSLFSGLWPAQHGIVGWFTHLPDRGHTIIPLRALERFTERSIEQLSIELQEVIQGTSLFPAYKRACTTYTFRKFKSGQYAEWAHDGNHVEGYRSLKNAVKRIKRNLSSPSEPSFSYLYLSEIDHLSHLHGWNAPEVLHEMREADRQLKRIRKLLPDSVRMIVTADHGHINVPKERHEILYPSDPLLRFLECPPSGESRVPLFHVKPGHEQQFTGAFAERFHLDFALITPDDAETLGLYGPVPLSEATRSRVGSYIGISPEADAIEYVYEDGAPGIGHIGMHGGMSTDEVEVPLFLA